MRALLLSALLLLAACARVPSPDATEAAAIVRAASELMTESSTDGRVPAERWPAAIRSLEPESVRIGEPGIYISTGSLYVEEWGLFVPRQPDSFVPVQGTDPSYEQLHPSLFSYFIAG